MSILSLIYSIPTDIQATAPQSPSPSDTEHPSMPQNTDTRLENGHPHPTVEDIPQSYWSNSPANSPPLPVVPGATQNDDRRSQDAASSARIPRQAPSMSRMRSSSTLPPRPPAPSNSPPTPPHAGPTHTIAELSPPSPRLPVSHVEAMRSRAGSVGHARTGSGSRLEALKEETASTTLYKQPYQYQSEQEDDQRRPYVNGVSRHSPPLPPLPSPQRAEQDFSSTPRGVSAEAQNTFDGGPPPSSYNYSRSRGGSSVSDPVGSRSKQSLISDSTANGTISQRREKNKSNGSSNISEELIGPESTLSARFAGAAVAQTTGRNRSSSFPVRPSNNFIPGLPTDFGQRHPFQIAAQGNTSNVISNDSVVSQPPPPPRRPSSTRRSPQPQSSRATNTSFAPPSFPPALSLIPPPPVLPGQLPTTPTSPLPPSAPNDALRRPYHLMNLLAHTMTSKSGGYITRSLHVPHGVWSQGGAKLANLPEKVRVLEVLCDALMELQNASVDFAGPMGVASGFGMGIGSITKKDGEIWVMKVEEFLTVCDTVVSNFGKKLSVGEGFVVKKSSGVSCRTWSLLYSRFY
jgi:hypothetical protein